MFNYNSSLEDFFNPYEGTFDARDLCQSLVVYANQYYNYYKSDNCEVELKKEMKAKAHKYKLRFIADFKKEILKDFNGYTKSEEMTKDFKDACKEICYENWDNFFMVLDWIKDDWSWEKGEHYFERFAKFSENGQPTMVHQFGFEDYARDLGEECYLGDLRRNNGNNPIMDFIDWEGWADFVKNDYTEVANPLNESRCIYYISY
jgi:hypothetical protein